MEGADRNLMRNAIKERDCPWCTCCLVLFVCTCHTMVLYGNLQTGGAIGDIGLSTGGWSGVGMDIAGSLQEELDEVMKNLTTKLTSAINHTLDATKSLDTVLGLAGDAAEALLGGDENKSVSLLQTHGMGPEDALPTLITQSLNTVMDTLIEKVVDGLDMLMEKLKPALLKAGELIQKFGDKIQNVIESFSITLDKAQKMFDQVMSQISGGEDMEERLLHETYGIFDVSSSGAVTAQDLKYTASLYNIPCLMGAKADELVEKYDEDGSKDLDKKEFQMMCHDEALPDIMSVVLRSFAKTLTEVAGNVGASKFRGEIADHVVEYITLMAAKNMTKVGWISDALGNASLPIEFTSDVFVKLALQLDDPNTHLELNTGEIFINTIMGLHPRHTAKAVDLISNSTYWLSEGFAPDDHGTVIERVTKWFTMAQKDSPSAFLQTMRQLSSSEEGGMDGLVSVDADGSVHVEKSVLDIMPKVARRMAEMNTRARIEELDHAFTDRNEKLFASQTSRYLLLHLNGGQIASEAADDSSSAASRAIKTGVPAKPETLLFAKFLSWNATNTANRFQKYCFDATQTSSNAIDGFATQIQSMIKKIQSFIKMMKKYSTPEGIEHLENKFADFAKNAATDLLKTVKKSVGDLINKSAPMLTTGLRDAIESTGMELGHTLAEVIATPLGKGLGPAIGHILGTLVGKEEGDKIADHIANYFSEEISGTTGDLLGKKLVEFLNNLVDQALLSIEDMLDKMNHGSSLSLLQMSTENLLVGKVATSGPDEEALLVHLDRKLGSAIRKTQVAVRDAIEAGVEARRQAGITDHHLAFHRAHLDGHAELETVASNAVSTIISQIQSLRNMLPMASKTLIFARTEVSKLAKNLDSIFETFADKGPPIFQQVAGMWNMAFSLYFCVMLLFPLILLYYAFWAGGFFGGPGQLPEPLEEQAAKQEKGCCATICDACCNCWIMYHDTTLCFWSCCIFLQIVTLLLFLVSLLFCILAAVQIFIASGCAQVYMLGDGSVCGNTLLNLRKFLASFLPGVHDDHMPSACHDKSLLLGQMIGSAMQNSAMLTVAGSLVASGATFQMIIESATLHSRAVVRREIAEILQNEASQK